ncbi:MAG: hypothetical protein C0395_05205 [Gemmatimonas sp.]|nr:hypothetical protein [Gemmatimonas sp.]
MTAILPATFRTDATATRSRRDEPRDGSEGSPFASTLAAQDRRTAPAHEARTGGSGRTESSADRKPRTADAPGNHREPNRGAAGGRPEQTDSRPGAGTAAVRAAAGAEAALHGGTAAAAAASRAAGAAGGDLAAALAVEEAATATATAATKAAPVPAPPPGAPETAAAAAADAAVVDAAVDAGTTMDGGTSAAAARSESATPPAPSAGTGGQAPGQGGEGASAGGPDGGAPAQAVGGRAGAAPGSANDLANLAVRTANAAGDDLRIEDGSEASVPESVRRQVVARLAGELAGPGGKGSLRLQLTPPQLGKVDVSFERHGQELHLTFRVESAEAARALRDGAHELTAALLDKQAGWDRVKVDVEREEPEKHDDGRDDRRGRDGRRDRDERDGEEGARR